MFAVLGTLVSTFIIGYLTYLAGKLVRVAASRVFCPVGGLGREVLLRWVMLLRSLQIC